MQQGSFKQWGLVAALALTVLAGGEGTPEIGLAQAGKTLSVCSSGCNFDKIQAAIDAAAAGDTIEVKAGSYVENLTIKDKQNLKLQGAGRDQATLDGSLGTAKEEFV